MSAAARPGNVAPAAQVVAVGVDDARVNRGWRGRLMDWVDQAYKHPGSRAHTLVFDLSIFLVMLSLLSMVLEGVPEIEHDYAEHLFILETFVVALFIGDYAASIYAAPDRRKYIFSFWGLIDLLAIVPYFFSAINLSQIRSSRGLHAVRTVRASRGLRALRALRVFRVVRVLKLVKRAQEASAVEAAEALQAAQAAGAPMPVASASLHPRRDAHAGPSEPTLLRDLQMGLVVVCSVLAMGHLFLEWEHEQLFWLALGTAAAANLAARRAFVRQGRVLWGIGLAVAALLGGEAVARWAYVEHDLVWPAVAAATVVFVGLTLFGVELRRRGGVVGAATSGAVAEPVIAG